ncbi:carotenoid oxygenase family protein [Kitasatospora sp. NPDC088351]|uniref:carotenoid oxygenase family protein n=1 Tax=Kitasatospora sp. NPDC088351 TaxID=3155180 RepID=UPI00342CE4D5
MTTSLTSNRYLSGSFAPVTEEVTAYDLPVTGRIPAHLSGRYLRTGPNPLGVEDAAAYIWTLGEGMVHGVRIRDGRAEWYRNRWVRSALVADRLGEPRRGAPVDERTDFAPNVQVAGLAGRTFALIEGGLKPYELTYELDTVGPCDLGATPAVPAGPRDSRPDEGFSSALLKHDLLRGTTEAHEFGRFGAVGEGVFVPAESSAAEDDGYVMAYVHNPERGAADLVILAAQDFTGEPLARVHLPVRVPLGLHGNWVPDDRLSAGPPAGRHAPPSGGGRRSVGRAGGMAAVRKSRGPVHRAGTASLRRASS